MHVATRLRYLLELLLLGAALLRPHFALDVLHHFDVGLEVFSDSLGEDEVEHQVVSLRLQHGDCIGQGGVEVGEGETDTGRGLMCELSLKISCFFYLCL